MPGGAGSPVWKSATTQTNQTVGRTGNRDWICALLLVVLVAMAYQPVWHAGFIWDDDAYVTENPMLTEPGGLRQIWFSAHRQSQYFPLVYTTFRLEHALWGLNPQGYHAVNVLFHAINALLLWRLLRRLAVPGAWLAAAIFALHPVQVESVAWVTELKNVQSTLFYLLALLAWVSFAGKPGASRWGFYWLALLFQALALFSKTTACTLPAALLLVLWWRGEDIRWRRILQVLPFLIMGLGMGLVSVWWEKHLGNYNVADAGLHLGMVQKVLIASRAVWFYAAKVFWPTNLTFSYPRWEINPGAPLQYLGLAGCVLFAMLLWRRRRTLDRGVTAGVIFFIAALSPLLGFIPLYTFRFSFVADHYQYLACAGLIVPSAAFIANPKTSERLGRMFCLCLSGCLLLVLGVLTWRQSQIYTNQEILWRDTLAKNPACWMAEYNLGETLLHQGSMDEAVAHFRTAVKIKPDYAEAHNNLGSALRQRGELDEAVGHLQTALQIRPDYAGAHYNLGITLLQKGDLDGAIAHLQRALEINSDFAPAHLYIGNALLKERKVKEAITNYEMAVQLKPDYAEAQNNLAWVLATGSQPSLRNGSEAVELAQRANELVGGGNPVVLRTLAAAYAESGRFPEAVATAQSALQLAEARSNTPLTEALRAQLKLYQAGQPFHLP